MATRLYAFNPGAQSKDVLEGVGAAASARPINLTVDIAATVVNEDGSTRVINETELLLALDNMKEHIMRGNWPPA